VKDPEISEAICADPDNVPPGNDACNEAVVTKLSSLMVLLPKKIVEPLK